MASNGHPRLARGRNTRTLTSTSATAASFARPCPGSKPTGCLQQMIDAAVNGHGIAYVPEDLVKQQLATGYWCRSGKPGPRIEILPADRDDTVRRMQRRVRAVNGYVRPRAWMTMAAGSATNAWPRERGWQCTSANSGDVRRRACKIAGRLCRRIFC
ncbi:hypothetical protein ELG61_35140 (plasmid) [Rhizobium leguminosarum]|nr:hypothetical protein ELG86_35605 [Rhizobium leguminosarum]TBG95569.1 hypothetical protein ELG70_32045 [Rhizobium leguminosarum]TBH27755.1 hypothetical protein ELG66_37435 [Rhizobium leguminosarum]TBH47810.1 hypothetical protein ELG65_32810 [Rhizobium leguminosarum]TBH63190.1 hypothetical protein ELG61_35140 [Rhizobium leguminosarum]